MYLQKQLERYAQVSTAAEKLYHKPSLLYTYEEIISGVKVGGRQMKAVDQSTFQAFGRFTPNMFEVQECYMDYFIRNKSKILAGLNSITGKDRLDALEKVIFSEIRAVLFSETDKTRLNSYNRIRKPINLYIQHIAAMAEEIENRASLIPYLYMPLDRIIFGHPDVFTIEELQRLKLDPGQGFGQIREEYRYYTIQAFVEKKSELISKAINKPFYPIYFDLFWNDRYQSDLTNLFHSNLKSADSSFGQPVEGMLEITFKEGILTVTNSPTDAEPSYNLPADRKWNRLNEYSPKAQELITALADKLEAAGISLAPKFRGDKAVVFTLANDESRNILTIWPQSARLKIKILNVIDAFCSSPEDFEKYDLIRLARKKYDDIR